MNGKFFIVAMSPDPENCTKLRKDTVPLLNYMGMLSLQKVEEMRTGCYPEISKEQLQARYRVMGGINASFSESLSWVTTMMPLHWFSSVKGRLLSLLLAHLLI
jgi:hypothetical protein